MRILEALTSFLVVCVLAVASANAQTAAGVIHGIVKDTTGAVAAGVKLTLTDQATNQTREQTSGPERNFEFRVLLKYHF